MGAVFVFYRGEFYGTAVSVKETVDEAIELMEMMEAEDPDDDYDGAYLDDGTVLRRVVPEEPDVHLDLEPTEERDLVGLLEKINAYQHGRGRPADVTDPIAFANDEFRESWEEDRLRRPRWLSRWRHRAGPKQVQATSPTADPDSGP
ncbi:hypothetical protein [Blastococcus mobilis]|uniref:Uncharacterized protein n=1 Tax=Blastococcus mobilis TaxID=1938746 RepID=A0A238ZBJ2_9ACTN|nr:hypothetical protein [Blastococcus mobilis]SNR80084.1 hypothetical protein SAMN06272737_12648 [Blastococcus mobilis]